MMQEAIALIRRIEIRARTENLVPQWLEATFTEPVIMGYRANGWFSIYFGADPMYQFDDRFRLRRAFVEGLLYRTQGTTLAELNRQRTESETVLLRRDLSQEELTSFCEQMLVPIRDLHQALHERRVEVLRSIPDEVTSLTDEVTRSLQQIVLAGGALAPAITSRR